MAHLHGAGGCGSWPSHKTRPITHGKVKGKLRWACDGQRHFFLFFFFQNPPSFSAVRIPSFLPGTYAYGGTWMYMLCTPDVCIQHYLTTSQLLRLFRHAFRYVGVSSTQASLRPVTGPERYTLVLPHESPKKISLRESNTQPKKAASSSPYTV